MSADALSFAHVHKAYGRGPKALNDLSFRVPKGVIAGFVGPNGAGKTTTYSIVSGYLRADSGEVDILGQGAFDPRALKGRVGVLPQDAGLPERHTPRELLVHLCRLQRMSRHEASRESDRVLELVNLGDRASARISSLSHGMRRRVAVASALAGSPELVLLDEPLAGLDPVQAHSLRERLASLRGQITLVVSSHNLSELERLCDWVVMLDKGHRVRQGLVAEVTGQGEVVRWALGPGDAPLALLAERLPRHQFRLEDGVLFQQGEPGGDLDESSVIVMATLAEAGVGVRGLARGMGLERRFLDDHGGH